ncbi:hypothetical protein Gorai_007413 [Gossypium raimondii]|uniref:DUF4283 domain-containing protein n=1 Tax=Gossypium raimondii TaxID=29730 RepID=A0A7J8Q7U0_GOSRA|nr:hypothetical protein [Gossypium raimondii]
MVVGLSPRTRVSWKDKLLGGTEAVPRMSSTNTSNFNEENFDFRPSQPFHLMDVENGYYLLWTVDFDPSRPFPIMVLTWTRFLGILGFLYKQQVFEEIESLVGKVARLDIKMDSGTRGHFSRMAVSVDLEKPLVS